MTLVKLHSWKDRDMAPLTERCPIHGAFISAADPCLWCLYKHPRFPSWRQEEIASWSTKTPPPVKTPAIYEESWREVAYVALIVGCLYALAVLWMSL